MKYPVALTVNGRAYEREVEARTLLVHFLREDFGCTGVRVGCDTSSCGSCLVLCDGKALKSCTRLAVQADGSTILTIEGLVEGDRPGVIQQCFQERDAIHCGFCAPGMAIAAKELLDRSLPAPTDDEVRRGLEGNLCRCAGYDVMVQAVKAAGARLEGGDG